MPFSESSNHTNICEHHQYMFRNWHVDMLLCHQTIFFPLKHGRCQEKRKTPATVVEDKVFPPALRRKRRMLIRSGRQWFSLVANASLMVQRQHCSGARPISWRADNCCPFSPDPQICRLLTASSGSIGREVLQNNSQQTAALKASITREIIRHSAEVCRRMTQNFNIGYAAGERG